MSQYCPATRVVGFRAKRPFVRSCLRRGSKEERKRLPHQACPPAAHLRPHASLERTLITIGIDPHKGSHTATAVDEHETVVGEIRVVADRHQRARLLEWAAMFEPRRWAVEGATGMGALLAQQLVGVGEQVVDVPPKLSARVRLMDTGRIASSGPKARHRLNPRGNRQLNHALYTAALVQISHDTPGRVYYERKIAEGKTKKEAIRALKRRISDVIYRQLLADTRG